MKNKDVFLKYFKLDESSPTYITVLATGKPAGHKQKTRHKGGYVWVVKKHCRTESGRKQFMWSIPKVIYELTNNVELTSKDFIYHIDGNKDNLQRYNLTVSHGGDQYRRQAEKIEAYNAYRNVILPTDSPDYFKDPSEWTTPEALELLAKEKESRTIDTLKFQIGRKGFYV
ncbi:hypothetical protein IS360_003594 [Salmonella enterica]|nr:hypothetical protein [Salmonella enterica]